MTTEDTYDYKNCQSLFGYARNVHKRSGGICQFCGCGNTDAVDFDLWRQMTVEHIIGESKGGYLDSIQGIIKEKFPNFSSDEITKYSLIIDEANTVTVCSFCNSTTSRYQKNKSMSELISEAKGTPEEVIGYVIQELKKIFEDKKKEVIWKVASIKDAFGRDIQPELEEARRKINIK